MHTKKNYMLVAMIWVGYLASTGMFVPPMLGDGVSTVKKVTMSQLSDFEELNA